MTESDHRARARPGSIPFEQLKYHLLIITLLWAVSSQADVVRCRTPGGKTIISDIGCPSGATLNSIRRNETPSPEQQAQAREVQARRQQQLNSIEAENSAWRNQPSNSPSPASGADFRHKDAIAAATDEEAIRQCIRDIERQGTSEDQKAQLITACRTAGSSQRATAISEDAVRNCVRNVERTGASMATKAKQIALCHGGDVLPGPRKRRLSTISPCDGVGCWDNDGVGGAPFRSGGKACQKISNTFQCA